MLPFLNQIDINPQSLMVRPRVRHSGGSFHGAQKRRKGSTHVADIYVPCPYPHGLVEEKLPVKSRPRVGTGITLGLLDYSS